MGKYDDLGAGIIAGHEGHIQWSQRAAAAFHDIDARIAANEAVDESVAAAQAAASDAAAAASEAVAAKNGQVVGGSISESGHLILDMLGGGTDDTGRVVAGPAEIAAAQGYWPIYSATPPAQTMMYGVPVVWLDSSSQLAPTPVLPPVPAWNDALSKFTVPSTVVGVDYVWTLGGGGVGQTLTQGAVLSTSGAYPRTVTITPVAKSGYVLASGVVPFVHNFYDPAAVTVLTSDGFSGAATTDMTGRVVDNALGGTITPAWRTASDWLIDGSGNAKASGPVSGVAIVTVAPAYRNTRVEINISTLAESLDVSIRDTSNKYVELGLSPTSAVLRVSDNVGGTANVGGVASGATLVPGPGLWILQAYQTTATVTDPAGNVRTWDLSDTTKFNPGTSNTTHDIWVRKRSAGSGTVIDSIKVSRVGF